MFDSYLILPSLLRTLAAKYKVEVQKGFFPYSFVNENNLDYIGPTPDPSYYKDTTPLGVGDWNMRTETIKYLESDLISLYQVVLRFAEDIFKNEKINIIGISTNSSIAFKIFKSNYLGDNYSFCNR